MTLFTQLGKNNVGTTKEVFNVHDAVVRALFLPNCVKRVMRHVR
jgi:hypothetical protein